MSATKGNVAAKLLLKWTENAMTDDVRYHHYVAKTPFGRFVVITYNKNNIDYYDLLETPWGNNEDFYLTPFYAGFNKLTKLLDMKLYIEKEFKQRVEQSVKLITTKTKEVV